MQAVQEIYNPNGYKALMKFNLFGYLQGAMNNVINRHVKLREGDTVLDAGCGYGLISRALNQKATAMNINIDQHAFDLSTAMPKVLLPYVNAPVKAQCADARQLSYKDNAFDTIICAGMFEHIEKPDDVLKEYRRCLKPGGQLIVFVSPKNFFTDRVLSRFGNAWSYNHSTFLNYIHNSGLTKTERLYFSQQFFLTNLAYFVVKAQK